MEPADASKKNFRIKLIEIEGLFRQYHHRIPLNLEDRVTVLHGRNGVGKTVTLSLVAALLGGHPERLASMPFARLRIESAAGGALEVQRDESQSPPLRFLVGPVGQPLQPFAHEQLAKLKENEGVLFIEAQRLFMVERERGLSHRKANVTPTVNHRAMEVAEIIKKADSVYRDVSTKLDNSLAARLFAPVPAEQAPDEESLARRAAALEGERSRLRAIGLMSDAPSVPPLALNAIQRAMFAVYLTDNEEKLAVFKDLADRAELLLRILNQKFAPKRLTLDKDDGYKAFCHDGRPLGLDALSSGEQHQLVLLHDLLFVASAGDLLLIDEPELSLHVTWQAEFLSELIEIAKLVRFDAVVATHSPYIVGSRRDLMVQLGEPV